MRFEVIANTPTTTASRWFLIILAAGAVLRFTGITFGMPMLSNFYVRPDETLIIVPAVRLFALWDYPVLMDYPQLMTLLTGLAAQLYYLFNSLWNPAGASNIIASFALDPSPYFIAGRVLSASAGITTIYLVYALGCETMSPLAGLLAASLYAVAPLAVRDAHFGVTDTLLTMLAVATAWALIRCLKVEGRRPFYFLLSCCLTGLAMAAKYTGVVLIIPVLWTIYATNRDKPLFKTMINMIILGGITTVIFLAVNHQFVSDLKSLKMILLHLHRVMFRTSLDGQGWNILKTTEHILVPLLYGPGMLPGMLCAIVGLWGIHNKNSHSEQQRVLFLSGAGFLFILLPVTYIVPYRYLLPVIPFIALFAATGVVKSYHQLLTRHAGWKQVACTIIVAFLIIPSMLFSVRMVVLLYTNDTRTVAGQWIVENIEDDIPIIIIGPPEGEPQLSETLPSLKRRLEYVRMLYGERYGNITGEIYDMQYRFGKQGGGYEIYRNPKAGNVKAPYLCVVNIEPPFFPSPFKGRKPMSPPPGKVIRHVIFSGVKETGYTLRYDKSDAFFIPFNHLDSVIRPGPQIDILVIQQKDSDQS